MQVGVCQFVVFMTRRANTTRVGGRAITARNILCIGNGHRQLPGSRRPGKQECVTDTFIMNRLNQPPFNTFLSYYISEKHEAKNSVLKTEITSSKNKEMKFDSGYWILVDGIVIVGDLEFDS